MSQNQYNYKASAISINPGSNIAIPKITGVNHHYWQLNLSTANANTGTISFWFKMVDSAWPANANVIIHTGNNQAVATNVNFKMDFISNGRINFWMANNANNTILSYLTPNGTYQLNVWNHFFATWNTAAGIFIAYANGSNLSVTNSVNNMIPNWYNNRVVMNMLQQPFGNRLYYVSEFYFNTEDYVDPANINKFIDLTTYTPKNLGSKGQLPTGKQPAIFLTGTAASFMKNKGYAGPLAHPNNTFGMIDVDDSPSLFSNTPNIYLYSTTDIHPNLLQAPNRLLGNGNSAVWYKYSTSNFDYIEMRRIDNRLSTYFNYANGNVLRSITQYISKTRMEEFGIPTKNDKQFLRFSGLFKPVSDQSTVLERQNIFLSFGKDDRTSNAALSMNLISRSNSIVSNVRTEFIVKSNNCVALSNGWYKIGATFTVTPYVSPLEGMTLHIGFTQNAGVNMDANSNSGMYVTGIQLSVANSANIFMKEPFDARRKDLSKIGYFV